MTFCSIACLLMWNYMAKYSPPEKFGKYGMIMTALHLLPPALYDIYQNWHINIRTVIGIIAAIVTVVALG